MEAQMSDMAAMMAAMKTELETMRQHQQQRPPSLVALKARQRKALRAAAAEIIGTMWIVIGGSGAGILAGSYPYGDPGNSTGLGIFGGSVALGLSIVTLIYFLGHVSGAHCNPAVSIGLVAAGQFPLRKVPVYVFCQVLGATIASACIYFVATRRDGFELTGTNPMAVNGYGEYSPGGYPAEAVFAVESGLTFFFMLIILGSTDDRAPKGFAPLTIGFALAIQCMISIPVSNCSINPARSTGIALFAGRAEHLEQLWMFWIAPLTGSVVAALLHRFVFAPIDDEDEEHDHDGSERRLRGAGAGAGHDSEDGGGAGHGGDKRMNQSSETEMDNMGSPDHLLDRNGLMTS